MMGAVLEVTSEPGLGSTFRFTVRFSCWESENQTDSAVSPLASKSANCLISSGSARVLLVEDNPVNLEVALSLLEETGCKVDTATNGVEALSSFGQTEYDMIFMDCQMPEMDGLEATRQIRRLEDPLGRRVPIIALTASAIDGDREACLATGMDDYLPKPFTPEQIRSVVGRWSSHDEKMLAV
jgi:two-component system, sensor histidine kinase